MLDVDEFGFEDDVLVGYLFTEGIPCIGCLLDESEQPVGSDNLWPIMEQLLAEYQNG